jgi:hypothetical protein
LTRRRAFAVASGSPLLSRTARLADINSLTNLSLWVHQGLDCSFATAVRGQRNIDHQAYRDIGPTFSWLLPLIALSIIRSASRLDANESILAVGSIHQCTDNFVSPRPAITTDSSPFLQQRVFL